MRDPGRFGWLVLLPYSLPPSPRAHGQCGHPMAVRFCSHMPSYLAPGERIRYVPVFWMRCRGREALHPTVRGAESLVWGAEWGEGEAAPTGYRWVPLAVMWWVRRGAKIGEVLVDRLEAQNPIGRA